MEDRQKKKEKTHTKLLPYLEHGRIEAGLDEVGRGCLAGPVVASAVVLPEGYYHPLLNDSKKISEKSREILYADLREKAVAYAIAEVSPEEIDEVNILNASFLAMHRALDQLGLVPEHLLVDGNRFRAYQKIPHSCIVKGDGKYQSIAAASVLAKVHRDRLMKLLGEEYPEYGWESNVGYPTKKHRQAIATDGVTEHHRLSFRLLPKEEV